jgi:hypothetical protein
VPFERHPLVTVLGAPLVVGVLAVIVVIGPGTVFHWLISFLIPLALVVLAVV